jgi:hypothetical protein
MVHFIFPILLLPAFIVAEDITTQIWMGKPAITYAENLQYSGSIVNVEDDRTTMVLTGTVIGPASEQSSLDSYYDLVFNTQATRFTFSGTTAFEFKSAWANGMYVNINRCQQYGNDLAIPVTCTNSIHSAWLETLCAALEEDKNLIPDQVTRTTVDDVGSTWTISGPNPKWTEDCVEGSDYIGSSGSGVEYDPFSSYPVLITAGGEKLAAQTGATPTPTEASKTESASSMSSGNEEAPATSTSTSESISKSTGTGVPQSITGAGNSTLTGTGTPPAQQTTSMGLRITPLNWLLVSSMLAFVFIL